MQSAARAASQSSCNGGCVLSDDLAAVGKRELEQAAGALGVDVDDVLLKPAIDRGFHVSENRRRAAWYSRSESASRKVSELMVDRIAECCASSPV